MDDNNDLLTYVEQGFRRIREQQGNYPAPEQTNLQKSLSALRSHFGSHKGDDTTVNQQRQVLRKATRFLEGVDDPTEDEQFAQRRIAAAQSLARTEHIDPELPE